MEVRTMRVFLRHLVLAFVAVLMVIPTTNALAIDYYVDGTNGDDSNSGLTADDAWKTITHALDAVKPTASSPATIHVASGVYAASTNGETLPIHIKSHVVLLGNDPETTFLDAEKVAGISIISCNHVSNVTISQLGIINAASQPALVGTSSDLVVRDCYFTNNKKGTIICHGDFDSGDLDSHVRIAIESSLFFGNGGTCVEASYYFPTSQAVVTNSAFTMNTGCIFSLLGDLTVRACLIQDNEAMLCDSCCLDVLVEKTIIRANTSDQDLFCLMHRCHIRNCVIENNTSGRSIFYLESGSYFIDSYMGRLLVENSLITGNHPGGGNLIRANYIGMCGPSISRRASVPLEEEQIILKKSTIARNGTCLGFRRGEPWAPRSYAALKAQDCILSDNKVRLCLAFWNDDERRSIPYHVDHCCLQEEFEGEGNFVADPIFASGPLGDYYLSSIEAGQHTDSLCIDAGSTSASIAGANYLTTRTDGAFDSGLVDIGYHYAATPPTIEASIAGAGASPLDGDPPRLIDLFGGIMPWAMADRALVPGEALLTQVASGTEKSRHLVAAAGATKADEGPVLGPGDTLRAQVTVANDGWPIWVDFYAGFLGADGTVFYITPDGLTTDFTAYAIDVLLDEGLHFGPASVFEFTLNEHV
nr:DUF1565 domain-containing protein [Bacillota bacterium]